MGTFKGQNMKNPYLSYKDWSPQNKCKITTRNIIILLYLNIGPLWQCTCHFYLWKFLRVTSLLSKMCSHIWIPLFNSLQISTMERYAVPPQNGSICHQLKSIFNFWRKKFSNNWSLVNWFTWAWSSHYQTTMTNTSFKEKLYTHIYIYIYIFLSGKPN